MMFGDGYREHMNPVPNGAKLRLSSMPGATDLAATSCAEPLNLAPFNPVPVFLLAWIELHRDELMADWELAVSGENPYKIAPL